ncbi:MAG TPA: hydrogenase maturation protease [Thermoleophilia bacterium]|nr:hydrogenase maturation protease [Acidobacteriota bacterium]NLT92043.1 hydrogenase maturation protease [Actinomycetota bacterium]OPZ47129.1 MAG: hydrogenase 1 maturation protease [Actinobacteria bacterium ADurb.BinA094]HOU28362.1 hydrogenase maturation protease [Thermoleophilia bacterium]HQF51388.1 hydrogenase maturation protease [Thermoleophilia bacterium]
MRYLVGVGGYLAGDDGVGPRVVDYVLENGLDQDLEAIDLSTDAVSLVAYLDDDTEAVLVVDAAHLGLAPGDFRVFSPEQVETRKELGGLTTHEGDVLKVLELAREAGFPIPPLAIMGIEPGEIAEGRPLSAPLRERLPEYAAVAVERLAAL